MTTDDTHDDKDGGRNEADHKADAGTTDNTRLTDSEISDAVADLQGWAYSEGSLTFTAQCDSPQTALDLVEAIGRAANAQDHHPDLLWSYDEVTLDLASHDVGGVTPRDIRLAETVSALTGEYGATPLGL